jgi:hypothetical protein
MRPESGLFRPTTEKIIICYVWRRTKEKKLSVVSGWQDLLGMWSALPADFPVEWRTGENIKE